MSMNKPNSRDKGQRGERELADLMKRWFGPNVRRGWQTRDGGEQADVEHTPWWLEAKFYTKHACFHHMRQAESAIVGHMSLGNPHRPAIVALRETNDPRWCLMFRLEDLPQISALMLGAQLPEHDQKILMQIANTMTAQLLTVPPKPEPKKAKKVAK